MEEFDLGDGKAVYADDDAPEIGIKMDLWTRWISLERAQKLYLALGRAISTAAEMKESNG